MNSTEHDQINLLLINYLTGIASEADISRLENWTSASNENLKYFLEVKNIWETSNNQFNLNDIATKKALNKVLNQINRPKFRFWSQLQRVAALLFIPLLLGSFLYGKFSKVGRQPYPVNQEVYNEVFAAYGTRSTLKLSDGSSVWLNSGSSLSYPEKFTKNSRIVKLKGEAYFEVHSDVTRPFIVQTQSVSVTATGTKFNVQAFSGSHHTQVTLVSGKVSVKKGSGDRSGSLIADLKPNQHLIYDSISGSKDLRNEDVYKYIAWKDGKLIFRNEPLSEIVAKISQLYNVDIELRGKSMDDFLYRATFQDESLSEILKLLKLSAPIDYREVKRVPLPDGAFPKKKIIIFSTK